MTDDMNRSEGNVDDPGRMSKKENGYMSTDEVYRRKSAKREGYTDEQMSDG